MISRRHDPVTTVADGAALAEQIARARHASVAAAHLSSMLSDLLRSFVG